MNDVSVHCWQVRKQGWITISHPSCKFIANLWKLSYVWIESCNSEQMLPCLSYGKTQLNCSTGVVFGE